MTSKFIFSGKNILFILAILILFPLFSAFSQGNTANREELWISGGAEAAMFSVENVAFGGGLSIGYGSRATIGLKTSFFIENREEVNTLELNLLFRWYFFSSDPSSGLFIQINAGPAFFFQNNKYPTTLGTLSAGLSLGWRFNFGRSFFAEGAIRGGYPYLAGVQLSAGYCF